MASSAKISSPEIDVLTAADWGRVRDIYLEGIATGNATFATDAPTWKKWDASHRRDCRLVIREGGEVPGWAALSPVSSRCVYAGVAELSVYVAANARGRGLGRLLLSTLVEHSERAGVWTLQAGIFPENLASIELHRKLGFRLVGVREKVGCMDGRWRDVALMERRSAVVGR